MAKSLSRTDDEIAEIYNRQVETVYRVCFAYLKNGPDTEDAVADTFVKLIKKRPYFESEEHEKAWLIRVAINVCKDCLKHWWRKRNDLADYMDYVKAVDTHEAKNARETDGVLDAVLGLPDKYKSVVYLYYFEGYKSAQIAQALDRPPSTIRNYLHDARAILRKELGDFYGRKQLGDSNGR
jgi:RNA polymerase sigma-70 factor (ECF subfamily)